MRSVFATLAATALLVAGGSGIALATGATHEFTGQISHLNNVARTLAVTDTTAPNKEMTFNLASDAKIMSNATTTNLAALRIGQHVVVKYSDEGAKHEAHWIDAHSQNTSTMSPARPAKKK